MIQIYANGNDGIDCTVTQLLNQKLRTSCRTLHHQLGEINKIPYIDSNITLICSMSGEDDRIPLVMSRRTD